ncbi:MAG: hypothetical protein WBM50_07215 [Acidimicrobiales bacterium]
MTASITAEPGAFVVMWTPMNVIIRVAVCCCLLFLVGCGGDADDVDAGGTAPESTGGPTNSDPPDDDGTSKTDQTDQAVTTGPGPDTTKKTPDTTKKTPDTTNGDDPAPAKDQQLTWPDIGSWVFGETQVIGVSASSGLGVVLVEADGSCALENGSLRTVRATGVGDCTVTAVQDGSAAWKPVRGERTYTTSKAQAVLESFSGTFAYDGDPDCLYSTGPGCRRYQLVAGSQVPVSFSLPASADQTCELDGELFSISNKTVLPRTCPILVTGSETATHLGFEDTREAVMNAFPVKITLNVSATSPDYVIDVSTNFAALAMGCGQPGGFTAGSHQVIISSDQVSPAGCSYQVDTLSGDASKSRECRKVNLPAAEVQSC